MGIGTQVVKVGGDGYAMIPKIRVQVVWIKQITYKLGDNVSYSKHDEQYALYRT
jgi:hypothetical protein